MKYNEKDFMLLTGLLLMFTLHATSKGRPVHLGSLKGYVGKPKPNHAPAKELVSLYQEDAVLHVRVAPGLFVIVTVKDEDGNILLQEVVAEEKADVSIPTGGATVEVSCNDVDLVGVLY